MQSLITIKESKMLEKIDLINIDQDAFEILKNPSKYFNQYTASLQNPLSIVFAHFSILLVIRKLDTSQDIAQKSADYFLTQMPPEQWIDTLIKFYLYVISLTDFLLTNHNNIILDLYNENKLSKRDLKKGMLSFDVAQKQLIIDKEETLEHIRILEKEKENLTRAIDNPNDHYDPYDPYDPDNPYN